MDFRAEERKDRPGKFRHPWRVVTKVAVPFVEIQEVPGKTHIAGPGTYIDFSI